MKKQRFDSTKVGCLLALFGPVISGVVWWLFPEDTWINGFWGGCAYFILSIVLPLYFFSKPQPDFYDDHDANQFLQ